MAPDTADLVAAILQDGYMVRNYWRGAKSSIGRIQRQQAILKMGMTIREAFNRSNDFEALIAAVADGVRPKDEQPF